MDRFPDYRLDMDGVSIHVNMGRINRNLHRAQIWLEQQIMNDMLPFMPLQTGDFQRRTRAMNTIMLGSGRVWAGAPPFGRFLFGGKVMVDPVTGSPKGAKKVLTDRDLTFSNPGAKARWFDEAKAAQLPRWKAGVKNIINER